MHGNPVNGSEVIGKTIYLEITRYLARGKEIRNPLPLQETAEETIMVIGRKPGDLAHDLLEP